MIHIVKGFVIVNKAEIAVLLELSCFFGDPAVIGNLISGSSALTKTAWTSGSPWFMYCWSLAWRILSMWDECNCAVVWAFFGIAFLWDWNENWPFPVLRPLLNFPNLLAYWVRTFTTSSFRIWNSSTGIPSPPLALFVVMLCKAHLT